MLKKYGLRADWELKLWEDVEEWNSSYNVKRISAGDCFVFDDVTVRVLRVFNPNILDDFVNNSSAVYRIENANSSFIILGDLGVDGGNEVAQNVPLELLQADYTQMAHHGQNGVDRKFYEYITPKKCIWAALEWLWNNDVGDGFNNGIATCKDGELIIPPCSV